MRAPAELRVAIDPDDWHAEHVGHTADGRQFFLTAPFEPKSAQGPGTEFIALYLFDPAGQLVEALIDSFGPRASMDSAARRARHDRRLADLGEVTRDRIEVAPFEVERFGLTFGLVYREPEFDGEEAAVEVMPGDYMAFFEPWDQGDYDT